MAEKELKMLKSKVLTIPIELKLQSYNQNRLCHKG